MNKLYHYLFGDNVANYVLLFINQGWSRILRRISKGHELDCLTKTQRKVYWSLDWCFPRRFMGTLARQNRFIFKIQLQQKIHPILHHRSIFTCNSRDLSFWEIISSLETEEVVTKSYLTPFVLTITYSEPTYNLWLITSTSSIESSLHNKSNFSTKELLESDQTLILKTENGFTILNFTQEKSSKEESDLLQTLLGQMLILPTPSNTTIWKDQPKNSDSLQLNWKPSSTTRETSSESQTNQLHFGHH